MDKKYLLNRTQPSHVKESPLSKAWNELHIKEKNGDVIILYLDNQLYEPSVNLKTHLLNNADRLDINVNIISSATLYECKNDGQKRTLKNLPFP